MVCTEKHILQSPDQKHIHYTISSCPLFPTLFDFFKRDYYYRGPSFMFS